MHVVSCLGFGLLLASCGGKTSMTAQAAAATTFETASLVRELAEACPPADPGDDAARQSCAERLASLPILRDRMDEPFLWGGQKVRGNVSFEDNHVTKFSPYVWRRMYLATFMFTGDHRVEEIGPVTVVHAGVTFRGQLDPGAYPYPFWHSEKKWHAYQVADEIVFIIEGGRIKGALRVADPDAVTEAIAEGKTARAWDGNWSWQDGAEPHVALYRNLFSPTNPHVGELERSYRALEEAMRPYNCAGCHAPHNPTAMNPLELLTYPNQALAARHALVEQLERNRMPPETADKPAGISDAAERRRLLELARTFAAQAERALEAEGEPIR
jgi:hypothetical protein